MPTSETLVVARSADLPTKPESLFERVSPSDFANLIRVKKTAQLEAELHQVTADIYALNEKATELLSAEYAQVEAGVLEAVNRLPIVQLLNITVEAKPIRLQVALGQKRVWYNEVDVRALISAAHKPQISICDWYMPTNSRDCQSVRQGTHAYFQIVSGSIYASTKAAKMPLEAPEVPYVDLHLLLPPSLMPEWHQSAFTLMAKEAEDLCAKRDELKAQLSRINEPGRIEASMTEHALTAAGINVNTLMTQLTLP